MYEVTWWCSHRVIKSHCYSGSHYMKGTTLTLCTVATGTAQFFIRHRLCYEIKRQSCGQLSNSHNTFGAYNITCQLTGVVMNTWSCASLLLDLSHEGSADKDGLKIKGLFTLDTRTEFNVHSMCIGCIHIWIWLGVMWIECTLNQSASVGGMELNQNRIYCLFIE